MFLPRLSSLPTQSLFTNVFGGYHHRNVIPDGEIYDGTNLSCRAYPALSTRLPRGDVRALNEPSGMIAKAQLVTIEGHDVRIADYRVPDLQVSTSPDMLPKKIVSMGAYVCIFPDAVYFNTINQADHGSMGALWEQDAGDVTLSLARPTGVPYDDSEYITSATAPAGTDENPLEDGTLWLDTSSSPHALKIYAASTGEWTSMASVYVRIAGTGLGSAFRQDDTVFISGITCPDEYAGTAIQTQLGCFNESMRVYERAENYILVAGILDRMITIRDGHVRVERKIPHLDYVVECDNRLWGCTYGLVDGQTVNEIHACAQGDFRNWYQFHGIATDSYTASCGTDGPFTGAAVLKNSPLFFKENCLHRVSGSMPSTYSVTTTMCRGIQPGSWRSAAVVGEVLMYKSRGDVMAYDGSVPYPISEPLGEIHYESAVGGALNGVYYLAMRDDASAWHLFTFDSNRRIWHHEDNFHPLCMVAFEDELYAINADTGHLISMTGAAGTQEDQKAIPFEVILGQYGYDDKWQKYLYRYNLRLQLSKGCRLTVYIQYDSSGEWETAGHVYQSRPGSALIPIIPRRCDHCQLKLSGTGAFTLYSLGRTYKGGSDHARF